MKELVTIQVGSYANYIGSHFWNFQDELLGLADSTESDEIFRNNNINMDVIYRSGETQQGIPTYTPRLLSIGFQGSLGSVSSRGTLYGEVPTTPVETLTWTGGITTHASEPLKKNLFLQSLCLEENEHVSTSRGCDSSNADSQSEVQDKDIVDSLENEVEHWTDFSKVHYHPKSLYEFSGLWTDIENFNDYGIGRDSFSGSPHGEEIKERLRFFLEECDLIQILQARQFATQKSLNLFSSKFTDGVIQNLTRRAGTFSFDNDMIRRFSGVAGEFLENIADEYTNIPVLLYSVRSPASSLDSKSFKQTISRNLHDAVSFSRLSTFSKLIVPVGLPSLGESRMSRNLSIKDEKPYHTSAVYASAIHSISLPFRMEPLGPSAQLSYTSGAVNVNELVQILSGQARQNMVTILDAAMPAPSYTGNQVQQALLEKLQTLTPDIAADLEDMHAVESMVVHGVFGPGSQRASVSEVQEAVQSAYENAIGRPRFSHLSVARCPLPIPLPFPSIFGNRIGQHGEILETAVSGSAARGSLEVHSIPMAARMRSSNAILPFLESKLSNLRRFGIARGALGTELLRNSGFGKDELEDMGETLSNMIKSLNPVSESSSDSD